MTTRVLLVDDHAPFVAALGMNLCARGYEVTESRTVEGAIARFDASPPDIVLLDLGLPDRSGQAVVEHIRAKSRVPILVVSARSHDQQKIALLDAGADGYVTKPFSLDELLARIRAALRKSRPPLVTKPTKVVTKDFEIDFDSRVVRTKTAPIRLTRTEWAVVDYLVQANGRVVPKEDLLTEVWGPDAVGHTNYIRIQLAHLRKKLEPDPSRPIYFVTEPRLGVRFEPRPLERND
jgi:two-component system KDP operon response regulator KdpE